MHAHAQNESFAARHGHTRLQKQLAICLPHFGILALVSAEGGRGQPTV